MLKIQCNVFNTASLCSNQAKIASRFSNKVLKANSSSKGRQWFVVRADLYKCGNCGNEFTQARIGRGLKCGKCGQKDANKFAVANRCTNCVGEGTCDCYECGGAGIIEQKSWEIEDFEERIQLIARENNRVQHVARNTELMHLVSNDFERIQAVAKGFSMPIAPQVAAAIVLINAALLTQPALASTMSDLALQASDGNPLEGFLSAFLLIFFSEIGDKTFFIALLLALQQPRSAVFAGTFGALAVMSFISVALGELFHNVDLFLHDFLPPTLAEQPLDDYAAIALLLFFGLSTILDAGVPKADEEREDAEEAVTELTGSFKDNTVALAPLILSTFILVFAAEWGDKSFLATIALAAASDPVGVVAGAIAGHGVATGIAVLGGSFLSEYVSEKTVAYLGGSLFLVFAGATVLDVVSR